MLVIWRVDAKGALYPLPVHKHQLGPPLNYCVLKHSATYVSPAHYATTPAPPSHILQHTIQLE